MSQPGEQTADDLWTTGPLLRAVQLQPLYSDSKTFVCAPQVQCKLLARFRPVRC